MKKRVIEKKTEEYRQYGQQIAALAKQCTTPDPDRLMPANVKQGDSVTFTLDPQSKQLRKVRVQLYLISMIPVTVNDVNSNYQQVEEGPEGLLT